MKNIFGNYTLTSDQIGLKERRVSKNATIVSTYLGSESSDEAKIAVGLVAKSDDGIYFDNYCDKKRYNLFHIRHIMKKTRIDTLIDRGSKVNLISEKLVKQVGLETKMHDKPYTLNWMSKSHKLKVTKQCVLQFTITSKSVDKVTCDVVPLDACGIVLGSPYLYDRKAILYREKNQY